MKNQDSLYETAESTDLGSSFARPTGNDGIVNSSIFSFSGTIEKNCSIINVGNSQQSLQRV